MNKKDATRRQLDSSLKSRAVDVEYINPFITAALKVFESRGINMKAMKPFYRRSSLPMDVVGEIAVVSKGFSGSISICFAGDVFLRTQANFATEAHTEMAPGLDDAAFEVVDKIFALAKSDLNDGKGYSLERATLTVCSGEQLRNRCKNRAPVIILPFESSVGSFHIEILIEE